MGNRDKAPQIYIAPVLLSQPPTIDEIGLVFSEAMRNVTTKLYLKWPAADHKSQYVLGVSFPNTAGEADWQFSQAKNGVQVPLWAYVTADVLLVYNLLTSSMHHVERRNHEPGESAKPPTDYNALYTIPESYYQGALELMAREQQKQSLLGVKPQAPDAVNSLSGDLEKIETISIYQTINLSRLTGAVVLKSLAGTATIHFEYGLPTNAVCGALQGEEAFLETFTFIQGEFHFQPDVAVDSKNIKQSPDNLLLEGMLLRDKALYLFNTGLRPDSIILRKNDHMAEAEFARVSKANETGAELPFSIMAQREYFSAVDDKSTAAQIAAKLRLSSNRWMPILCRMIKNGYLDVLNQDAEEVSPRLKLVDRRAIHSVMTSLRRVETGLYAYPVFLYFLEQEVIKARRSEKPLSLVVIEARISGGRFEHRSPLPSAVLGELVRRISTIKREQDMLAHYEVFDIAVILPGTDEEGAAVFAKRVSDELRRLDLTEEKSEELLVAIGTATLSEHVQGLEALLGAVESAKKWAQHSKSAIASYSEPRAPKPF
jgi:diguanylate cyclase (GGDEF)-like protein